MLRIKFLTQIQKLVKYFLHYFALELTSIQNRTRTSAAHLRAVTKATVSVIGLIG